MPKTPKTTREYNQCLFLCLILSSPLGTLKRPRASDPRLQNVSFREALGLTTSEADMDKFAETKKALREAIERHYDYNILYGDQSEVARATFETEVLYISAPESLRILIQLYRSPIQCLRYMQTSRRARRQTHMSFGISQILVGSSAIGNQHLAMRAKEMLMKQIIRGILQSSPFANALAVLARAK